MKKVMFLVSFVLTSLFFAPVMGQTIKKDAAGNYAAAPKSAKQKVPDAKTAQTYTDSKGRVYPMYRGARGGLYALITSASGNVRKQYMKQD